MSRKALQTLIRAMGTGRVGLHSGQITCLPSLLDSLAAQVGLQHPICTSNNTSYLSSMSRWNSQRRSVHTTTATSFANFESGSGRDSGSDRSRSPAPTAAEEYDLLPPDTGIVRIEGCVNFLLIFRYSKSILKSQI